MTSALPDHVDGGGHLLRQRHGLLLRRRLLDVVSAQNRLSWRDDHAFHPVGILDQCRSAAAQTRARAWRVCDRARSRLCSRTLLFSTVGSEGITPFLVGCAIILLAAIPIFLARKESPALDEKPAHHFVRYIWLVPMASAAAFVFGAVQAGGLSLFPIYATREGFNESQAALLLTVMAIGNMTFQIPIGLLSDRITNRRLLLGVMAFIGLCGTLALPLLVNNWIMVAVLLLLWGGLVSGMYTVGLTHLGSRLTGSDLVAANAAFIFCYATGTIAGPQTVGIAMDISGSHGFAWALALFFGFYVVLSIGRSVFGSKQT